MSVMNFGQIREMVATTLGIQNSAGNYDFDGQTAITLQQVTWYTNNAIRELNAYDYTFNEDTMALPFWHTISGVQSVTLTCTGTYLGNQVTGTGIITPYPFDVLNYTQTAQNSVADLSSNFANIPCSFVLGSGNTAPVVFGVSISGQVSWNTYTGLGFNYTLPENVGRILGVFIQHADQTTTDPQMGFGIQLPYVNYHDFITTVPIGDISATGTPVQYTEIPGMGQNNQKVIRFFPQPIASGQTFQIHYMKQHNDFTSDSQIPCTPPEKFQEIISYAVLEKIALAMQDERYPLWKAKKDEMIADMKVFDGNNPNIIRTWRDFTYRGGGFGSNWNSPYNTSTAQPL